MVLHTGVWSFDWRDSIPNLLENDTNTQTFQVPAETVDPVLATSGSEIENFDFASSNPDETSERFQALVHQFNYLEIVHIMEHRKPDLFTVTNSQFDVGQVVDMGIEWGEMTSKVTHVYLTYDAAQKCALATMACYMGQPDMIVGLVNE